MTTHKVVKHDEWLKKRRRHLGKERSSPDCAISRAGGAASRPGSSSKSTTPSRASTGRRHSATCVEDAANVIIMTCSTSRPRGAENDLQMRDVLRRPVSPFCMDNFNSITITESLGQLDDAGTRPS